MLVGVLIFGIGDFSRTFLVLIAATALASGGTATGGTTIVHYAALPMLLYAMHNAVSALVAYPVGHLGDRRAKMPLLVGGYALGVVTNVTARNFQWFDRLVRIDFSPVGDLHRHRRNT